MRRFSNVDTLKLPQVRQPVLGDEIDLDTLAHRSEAPIDLADSFDRARRALEAAQNFDEVKGIRDQAETLRAHAKRVKWSLDIQNQCAEIKLRAERKAGAILGTFTVKGGESRKSHDGTYERHGILDDLGISRNQSSRWQAISRIPDEAFEDLLSAARIRSRELTQAEALRLASRLANLLKASDEADMAKQRSERIIKSLAAIKRDLESVQKTGWNSISKDTVREALEALLALCR
jgi:hypothetical protein